MNINDSNIHERDKRIVFYPEPHEYHVDGEKYSGSVTGFIESFFDKFDAKQIIRTYYDKWQNNKHPDYFKKTHEEILEMWNKINKKALIKGNTVHNFIDNLFCNMVCCDTSLELKSNPLLTKEHGLEEIKQFIAFYSSLSDDIEPYRSEWYVFDEEYKIAGSIDLVCKKKDGTYLIIDWKTNREIKKNNPYQLGKYPLSLVEDCNFNHYQLQLNTYKYILQKNYGIKVSGMIIVHLSDSNNTFQLHSVNNFQPFIKKMLEMRITK